MRLFFAVLLPEEARKSLLTLQSTLQRWTGKEGIKWESEEHFHFTLKFLGNAPPNSLSCVRRIGREAAGRCAPFETDIENVSAFPDSRRPKTLWAGPGRGVPHLTQLAEYLDSGLAECGFEKEKHRFKPHLTLARVKTQAGEKAVGEMLTSQAKELKKVDKGGVFSVSNVVLIQSELKPQGSVYTVLDSFTLGGVNTPEATRVPADI